jgi:hypothetical protein
MSFSNELSNLFKPLASKRCLAGFRYLRAIVRNAPILVKRREDQIPRGLFVSRHSRSQLPKSQE